MKAMHRGRIYTQLPPIANNYPLEQGGDSWFSVIVPIQRTNEVTNPSAELGTTTGYTAGAGTLTASTEQQYHGARSFKYVPSAATTDGFYYTLTSTVAFRAVSCKFRGMAGKRYALTYATSGGVDLVVKEFVANGRWQWIYLYYNEASATTRRIYFRKNGDINTTAFYVDGVQSETLNTGETVSTYIDGDQTGLLPLQVPPAYYWNGTPHASTSMRTNLTRAGGMIVPFNKYGFVLLAVLGLGLAPAENVSREYAVLDGGYDQYTRKPSRQFTLTGRFDGQTPYELDRNRGGLSALLDRDLPALEQELILRYEKLGELNESRSEVGLIRAKYQDGLQGNNDNLQAENVPITFTQNLPLIMAEGEVGATLNVQTSVANANDIIKRSPTGTYSALGTGAGATSLAIQDIAVAQDGKVYVTGFATNIGGLAAADGVAYWDPSAGTWNAMTTGLAAAGGGYAIAFDASGRVYIGGSFTSAGGVANTANLARWTGSAWESITGAGSANGIVTGLAFDSAGNLYACGSFTSVNGVAANRVAKMDTGGTWTALSTGLNGTANAVVVDVSDNVYLGGAFTSPTTRVTKWNGSAFSALGSGLDGTVRKLAIAPSSGLLYAAGDFTSGASSFNGVTWSILGSGLSGGVSQEVVVLPSGIIAYGGQFTAAGGITLPDMLAFWNGGSWTLPDVDLPGTSNVNALAQSTDGSLYIGFETNGTATATGVTTVNNPGTARTYPIIKIYGPSSGISRIWTIRNETTGRTIYLNGSIQAGDVWTFSFQPDNLSFTSALLGPLDSKILVGSSVTTFYLEPGDNVISMLAAGATVTATISFHPSYLRLSDITR